MTANQVRETFLSYFETHDHIRLPSASLIPADDPTLLLTTAGMVPFKKYFSKEIDPPHPRITTVQKSFRTTDIEEVGDATHLTLFEMLGNFSFGDYFKKEACEWALDLSVNKFGLDNERLFFTVYLDDDEAELIWQELGVPKERIYRFGKEDNWWGPAGNQGACGPCSELHYYTGDLDKIPNISDPNIRRHWGPNLNNQFIEFYNLVFTQFYRDSDGNDKPLPHKNIDTGMGLERMVTILQGANSIYETDHFQPLIKKIEKLCGKKSGESPEITKAINVTAEHIRSSSFLIADGVLPSNTGRGYVLRRIIRRGMLFARELGISSSKNDLSETVVELMGSAYPELSTNISLINQVLDKEEENFSRTIDLGARQLEFIISKTKPGGTITGSDAAFLYDTFGFPIEMTQEITYARGLQVDIGGFEKEMNERKEMARTSGTAFAEESEERKLYESIGDGSSLFVGYETLTVDSDVIGIIKNNELVSSAAIGDDVEIILKKTPFYASRGGQIGDTGRIFGPNVDIDINDTRAPFGHLNVHFAKIIEGIINVGDNLTAKVDKERREKIRRNHTATHLVHAALRDILGPHVRQSGSVVAPEYLRFDFTHMAPPTKKEIRSVQDLVNKKIRLNIPVEIHWTTHGKAVEEGALAFFGDTYENDVRTIKIDPPWSYELCGGTHMESTGGIGAFVITAETGIGSGIRRIFALTGIGAESAISDRFETLQEISGLMKSPITNLTERTLFLINELSSAQKTVKNLEQQLLRASIGNERENKNVRFSLENNKKTVEVEVGNIPASTVDSLRDAADHVRNKLGSGVVVLGAIIQDRPAIVVMLTKDLANERLHAGKIARILSKYMGGGGGGNALVAQGGGKRRGQLDIALSKTREIIECLISE